MYKIIRYLTMCVIFLTPLFSSGQDMPSVFQAEYFWGTTDPGAGNGIPILAKDGSFDDAIESVFANGVMPPANGINLLNIRMRGVDGAWGPVFKSIVNKDALFSTSAHVTQAEFYIDTDLGAGNNQAMLATDGNFNDVIEGAIRSGISAPAAGLHILGVRYKNVHGAWGPVFKSVISVDTQFSTNLNLVQGEYFYDGDPGEGAGFPLLAADGSFNSALESIMAAGAVSGLAQGPHLLSARLKGSSGTWGPVFSIVFLVDPCVPSPSAIVSANGPASFCVGDSVLLNANVGTGLTYQWRLNGAAINGATSNSYYAKQAGSYTVVVTNAGGCSAQSTGLTVTTTSTSAVQVQIASSVSGSACQGTVLTFTAQATNATSAATYQWQVNGTNVGTNTNTYTSSTLNNGDVVRCILAANQACVASDTSNLTVSLFPALQNTISVNGSTTLCQGSSVTLTAPQGNTYLWNTSANTQSITVTTSGSYNVTVRDVNGCTTTSNTVQVTVGPHVTSTVNRTACGSFTWVNGNGQTYTSSTTATHTVPNGAVNGCDSVVTLNLIINHPVTNTVSQTACGSFTWTNGNGQTYTSSTTVTHLFPNGSAAGCDSTVTLNLTINQPATHTLNQSACGSFTWTNGNGQTYTSSTTATHTIPNGAANGCDSTITLNLTINQPATHTVNQSACGSFTWTNGNGQTYTSSTTAMHVIPNGAANGCDSIVTLNLTIGGSVDKSVTQNGTILTANQTGAAYQWVDCGNNNSPIVGATSQSFTALANGSYAVLITVSGCSPEISACVNVNGVGIDEKEGFSVNAFPNPSTGIFTITNTIQGDGIKLVVYNSLGQIIFDRVNVSSQEVIDLSNHASGVYFVKLIQKESQISILKLIKR